MASTLIQFRIEKDEKQRSSQILETMGLKLDDRIPEEGTGIELPS